MHGPIQQGYQIRDRIVLPLEGTIVGPAGSVHLEPKVMDVLNHLVLRENEIVSIQDLMDAVWHPVCVSDDCLYGAISHLRKALADGPERRQVLQTIPKRGYRLVGPIAGLPVSDVAASKKAADDWHRDPPPSVATSGLLSHCVAAPRRQTIARLTMAFVTLGWSMIVITLATLMAIRVPSWYLLLAAAALLPPVVIAALMLRLQVRAAPEQGIRNFTLGAGRAMMGGRSIT